jgi:prolipoprotein diacylglyceryl transferase
VLPLVAQIPPPPFDRIPGIPLDVRMYGILVAIGAYLGLRLAVRRYERFGGQPEVAERVALWVLGAAFLGARIGYVIPRFFDNPNGTAFIDDPLAILAIWEGGLAFFGGLFAGALAGFVLVRRWNGDVPAFADAVAPALPLAQAIGRWGNYFNQELYGRPTDLPWALEVEDRFRRPGFESEATFHPTFLYESLGNLILVAGLLVLERTGRLRRGALMWCYVIGYGVLRAVVESLRVDTDARYLGLSRNNWIAIVIVVAGLAGLMWWQRRHPAAVAPDPTEGHADAADEDPDDVDAGPDHEREVVGAEEATGTPASNPSDEDDDDEPLSVADGATGELAPDDDEADEPRG